MGSRSDASIKQWELDKYQPMWKEARENPPPFVPEDHQGRGIVICAGGPTYFTNAYVCVRMLRHWGCNLPIEFWHLGVIEMDDDMRKIVEPLGVECVDSYEVRKKFPARRLFGWELNPYSIIHSKFREVIFLDADNVPLIDPEILFDTPEYKQTGAIFWPDFGRLAKSRGIWRMCDVPYRDEPEFESGQIVIDKERCWQQINLTMHLNEHSDFYYEFFHGDKESFHMAWHMCGTPYSMPRRRIHALKHTMCQHDFQDKRIFQHRNMRKWSLNDTNVKIAGFLEESRCLGFLDELREIWDGFVKMPEPQTEAGKDARNRTIRARTFTYHRVGKDRRTMDLDANGRITRGAAGLEKAWMVQDGDDGVPELSIIGNSITCTLREDEDGIWRGRWINHEQMPIELIPQAVAQAKRIESQEHEQTLEGKRFVYIRVGYDKRLLQFDAGNKIGVGKAGLERVWEIKIVDGKKKLCLGPNQEHPICELELAKDGVWRGAWNKFEKMDIELVEVP